MMVIVLLFPHFLLGAAGTLILLPLGQGCGVLPDGAKHLELLVCVS